MPKTTPSAIQYLCCLLCIFMVRAWAFCPSVSWPGWFVHCMGPPCLPAGCVRYTYLGPHRTSCDSGTCPDDTPRKNGLPPRICCTISLWVSSGRKLSLHSCTKDTQWDSGCLDCRFCREVEIFRWFSSTRTRCVPCARMPRRLFGSTWPLCVPAGHRVGNRKLKHLGSLASYGPGLYK